MPACVRLPGLGVTRVDRARLGVASRLGGRLAPRARVVDDVETLLDDLLAGGAGQQLEAAIAAAHQPLGEPVGRLFGAHGDRGRADGRRRGERHRAREGGRACDEGEGEDLLHGDRVFLNIKVKQ